MAEKKVDRTKKTLTRRDLLGSAMVVGITAALPSSAPPFESGEDTQLLERAENLSGRWGHICKDNGLWQWGYFPPVARLVMHPETGPWSIELEFRREEFSRMTAVRREIEDLGVWMWGGKV